MASTEVHSLRFFNHLFVVSCFYNIGRLCLQQDGSERVWYGVTENVVRCDVFPSGGSGGKGKQRAMRGSGVVS